MYTFQLPLHMKAFTFFEKTVTVKQVENCVEMQSKITGECKRIQKIEDCLSIL